MLIVDHRNVKHYGVSPVLLLMKFYLQCQKKKKKKEEFMNIPFRKETQETVKEIMEEFHRPNKTNIKKKNCTTSTCKAIIY